MAAASEAAVAETGSPLDNRHAAAWMADIERLYAEHAGSIFLHAYHLLGNAEDAHDARQETFLRAYRGLARFRGDSSAHTWLITICTNVCRNRARAQAARREVAYEPHHALSSVEVAGDPLVAAERSEQAELLRCALSRLSARQREVIVLRDIQEMEFDEIAAILGCARVSVPVKLFRARRKLRDIMIRLIEERK